MSFLDSIILGLVEGFTEFLPISSTAHLILTSEIIGLEISEFLKTFEIAIQLGAILAVVVLYRKTIVTELELNKKVLTAFLPTALIGLVFYKFIKNVLLDNPLISIYALLFGGIVLVVFELLHKETEQDIHNLSEISYKNALLIGLAQSISIIPGVSRAAATILSGLMLGINRKTIVEFSFLLAIPTMAAATGLDLIQSYNQFTSDDLLRIAVGFIVSFITAIISIKFLLRFIQNNNFTSFGIYRIVVAILFLFLLV